MNEATITIIGNGGCINSGLPYNAFIFNNDFLIEAPPDIMFSLQKLNISFDTITSVFISHLHGDHCFGLPFLVINKWMHSMQQQAADELRIYGPPGIEEHSLQLVEMAFSKQHPCYEWAREKISFVVIVPGVSHQYLHYSFSFFELEHIVHTYGLQLMKQDRPVSAYIADTRWCDMVEQVLKTRPGTVLLDLNGGNLNVHMSPQEVIDKGLPLTGDATTYYGIHLFEEFKSGHPRLICTQQGMRIKLSE